MPDILVLVSQKDAELLAPHFHKLATVLRMKTAEVLGLKEEQVQAYLFPWTAASNGARVQILCIAKHSQERQEKLSEWRIELGFAWNLAISVFRDNDEIKKFGAEVKGQVEIFPLLPIADWGIAPS